MARDIKFYVEVCKSNINTCSFIMIMCWPSQKYNSKRSKVTHLCRHKSSFIPCKCWLPVTLLYLLIARIALHELCEIVDGALSSHLQNCFTFMSRPDICDCEWRESSQESENKLANNINHKQHQHTQFMLGSSYQVQSSQSRVSIIQQSHANILTK